MKLKRRWSALFLILAGLLLQPAAGMTAGSLSAGAYQNLVVREDGTLWAFGRNEEGQLGNGSWDSAHRPEQIGAESSWSHVSSGQLHTVAIKSSGTLWAWGDNQYFQIGDGTSREINRPVQIGSDSDWAAVSAGGYHTVALKKDGSLWAWGRNDYGQLGNGTLLTLEQPAQVGTETDWAAVSAGRYHTLALKKDGTLRGWGRNRNGELGDGTQIDRSSPVAVGAGLGWVSISAGNRHAAAVAADGTLWTWGDNYRGQLGNGTQVSSLTPLQVGTGNNWRTAAAGGRHTVAQRTDGSLWAWGDNSHGQLGDHTTKDNAFPARIGLAADWLSIGAGMAHTAAVKRNGTLWTTGNNWDGQLGDGTWEEKDRVIKVLMEKNPLPQAVNAGDADRDGSEDIALLHRRPSENEGRLTVLSSAAGGVIWSRSLGSRFAPRFVAALPGTGGKGRPDLAVFAYHEATGQGALALYAADSGQRINLALFACTGDPRFMNIVPDRNANGFPEVALLTVDHDRGISVVDIIDSGEGTKLASLPLPYTAAAEGLSVLGDITGDEISELVFLGAHHREAKTVVQVMDGVTGDVLTTTAIPYRYTAGHLVSLTDMNANGAQEVALTGVDYGRGVSAAAIIDSASGALLKATDFSPLLLPKALTYLPDQSGNGYEEIALLGGDTAGKAWLTIRESATGALLTERELPAGYTYQSLFVLGDMNSNDAPELGLLGYNRTGQTGLLIVDSATGVTVRSLLVP